MKGLAVSYYRYLRKGTDIAGWTYHADIFCKGCGDSFPDVDPEGNPKRPVFVMDLNEDGRFDEDCGGIVPDVCGACGLVATDW